MIGRDQALYRDRAQIGDDESANRIFNVSIVSAATGSPKRAAPSRKAEEDAVRAGRKRRDLSAREHRIDADRRLLQHDHLAADQIEAAIVRGRAGAEEVGIGTAFRRRDR